MEKPLANLFEKMKSKNFFWCYAKDITAADIGIEVLVETVFKYGDVEDIRILFKYLDHDRLFDIWVKRVVFDQRFEKLNFYLARIFFNVDLDAVRRERAGDDRRNKLEQLAARNKTST